MKDNLEKHADLWLKRVENLVAGGMGDVYVTVRKGTAKWVELKACPYPTRRSNLVLGTKYGLNVDQRNWHMRMAEFRNPTFILVRAGDALFMIPGGFAFEVNDWTLAHMDKYQTDWTSIANTLRA